VIKEISDFLHSFKNKTLEVEDIVKLKEKINQFANDIKVQSFDKEYEENFLTILGYSYRLDNLSQRIFYTFQEAVYAIDLDILMKNEDSKRLNSIVYILVLEQLIKYYETNSEDEELKQKALETYSKRE
jgi:Txe/YoeB family toxin of Txe-Axe toxin-antitoxin module